MSVEHKQNTGKKKPNLASCYLEGTYHWKDIAILKMKRYDKQRIIK